MRKPFGVMLVLTVILGSILSGLSGGRLASFQAVSAYAPPPLTPSTPTPPPVEFNPADQPFPTPPFRGSLPPKVEEARVRQVAQAVLDKYARHYGSRYEMTITEVRAEGEWAYAVAESETTDGESLTLLAHRGTDGSWQALMPSEEGVYLWWIDEVPERLVTADEKDLLRLQATECDTTQSTSTATFSLDGVELDLSTSLLSELEFATSDPNTAIQIATATERKLIFKELSITAVPFGLKPPTESLPTASSGSEEVYRTALREHREEQGWDLEDGPVVSLFGKDIAGATSVVDLHIQGEELTRVAITEWVVEAGNRIWIVRASHELNNDLTLQAQSAAAISLHSDNLEQPSTSYIAMQRNLPPRSLDPDVGIGPDSIVSDLPFPSWWSGECDTNNYYAATGVHAYPLGAEYRGMKACGPRPYSDNGPVALVNFGVGVSQYEWQCPELSKRYLYLAYGISPYSANGSQVVWNYSGDLLDKIPNCTSGTAPVPNDVLSYGSTSTFGHTSVVVSSDVGSNGNGTISVIEQNSSSNGFNTIDVNDWCVAGNYGGVSGWLHKPNDCPQSGGVILYRHANYDCGGEGEGTGYVLRSGTGWQNVPGSFNDQASSLKVPSGWSVRLYEHSDRNGASVCRNGDDNDFAGDYFDSGSVPLNDRISSFEVFDNSSCSSSPPGPGDGIELCDGTNYGEPCQLFTEGQYPNLADYGWYDRAESVRFRGNYVGNYHVVLYTEQNFAGTPYHADNDVPDLGDAHRNRIRSLDIYRHEPSVDAAEFVSQSPYPTVQVEQQFTIYFEVRNTGTTTWRDSDGYGLENINGETLGAWQRQEIGGDVPPGATKRWDIQMTAPATPGVYRTQWMLCHYGTYFGPNMYIDVTVTGGPLSDITVSASPDPVTMDAGDFHAITYTFVEHAGTSAHITSREAIFKTPSGTPVSDVIGPYGNDIDVPANGSASWVDNVYLPPAVVVNALELGVSSVVLYTTYYGNDQYGRQVSTQAELQIDFISCPDSHEFNNTLAQATPIAYGQALSADICPSGDYDFYSFTGVAGDKVVIDINAASEGSSLDPYIYLLNDSGEVLAENDDEITGQVLDSHLGYHLTYNGTYYIKVRAWDHPDAGGPGHFYDIHLLTDDIDPSQAEITSPNNDSWLDGDLQAIDVIASDGESGVNRVEFLWHDGDWENSEWVWLGMDRDGRDGWSLDWDTSAIPEQSGMAIYVWAFDWVGNWTGAGAYSLGIDRTPPTVVVNTIPMYDDAPFRDFHVRWWDSYDNLSGIATYDVQYRDGPSGTWTNLVIGTTDLSNRFVGEDQHTYYFRARARDNAGNQSAYAGGDGDAQYTVDICDTAPDAHEADNVVSSARWIATDGTSQMHNIHAEGDEDWVKFYAAAGVTYTLATTNTGGHADTVLYLYRIDGSTLIDSNDDYPGMWPASRLDWQPSASGTYYAKVNHWDPWAYGCTTGYGLTILTNDETPPTGSVSINSGATYAASTSTTLALVGTDTGTGVGQVMVSNNSGFGGATWTAYATLLNWALTAGDGVKTVYVKFRDRAGNISGVYSDTIILDTTAPTGSILIQGGAAVVTQTQVVLTLAASDAHGVTHMRLRNGTAAWGAWEPFTASRTWALPVQGGERVVWVQFRDPAGNVSPTYSDSVVYQFPHHTYLPLIARNK